MKHHAGFPNIATVRSHETPGIVFVSRHSLGWSKHRQRDAFVKLRWEIRRDTPTYGGLFTRGLVLHEPARPDAYRQWFDVQFLGF